MREIWRDELGEEGIYAINDYLVDMGYDATKHIEGLKSGKPHTVRIFINPDAVEVIDPSKLPIKEIPEITKPGKITPKTKISQLTYDELDNLSREVGVLGQVPAKVRDGWIARLYRHTISPPVHVFSQFGMERQLAKFYDRMYAAKNFHDAKSKWMIDLPRRLKADVGRKWGDDIEEGLARVADGIPIEQ